MSTLQNEQFSPLKFPSEIRTKMVKKNAKQHKNHSALPSFTHPQADDAKVVIFSLSASVQKIIYQRINNRAHWHALLFRLCCYPFPCPRAYSPADRHALFAESLAPCALTFTAPVVFVLIHHISRLIVSPFRAVSRLDYLALTIISFSCALANVALLHIKYKVVASPALHKVKFLFHIISFNKGGCPPLYSKNYNRSNMSVYRLYGILYLYLLLYGSSHPYEASLLL